MQGKLASELGLGNRPAADHAGVADRVEWTAERADGRGRPGHLGRVPISPRKEPIKVGSGRARDRLPFDPPVGVV